VALDTQDFVGAKVLDSTTAELSAICHGLRCSLTPKAAPSRPAELCSDSELLIEWVQGTASILPKETYEALVDSGQALLKDVQQSGRGTRVYVHVKSWMGQNWHDAADALARRAMQGAREPALRHRKMRLRTTQGRRA
jgi:ribonuclease HI